VVVSRRRFVRVTAGAACAAALPVLRGGAARAIDEAPRPAPGASAAEVAADDSYWAHIQSAFDVDRTYINLNNGGCSPSPRPAMESLWRHEAYSNLAPVHHMWDVLEPRRESVRESLARLFGSDAEEMALTRNATESLQTCLLGIELKRGDEILTTDQDYPRMLAAIRQRARREGVVLRTFPLPTPARSMDELTARYEEHITPRTRLILACHCNFLNGQILPIRRIVEAARRRDIPCVIDGAHAYGQFVFHRDEIDCDYYGTSLHKWIHAPVGAGFLYVRRPLIRGLWPLMPCEEALEADIRKFEEIGTHPAANRLAVAEALAFHRGIGPARKEARLRYLRNRWAARLAKQERVRLLTNTDAAHSCGLGTFAIEGVDAGELRKYLFARHRIIVAHIDHPDVRGIRVTASVYTHADEVDRFCEVIESVIRNGLPKG